VWKPTQFTNRFYLKFDQINNNRKLPIIVNHIETFKSILTKPGLYR